VRALQTLLNRHGFGVAVDGDFGPGTEGAVRAFQSTHYLVVDGVVGSSAWQALLGTGVVSLQSRTNNAYVTAENAGASPLIANRGAVGPWERFDMVPLSDGNIALLALTNNRFVTAGSNGDGQLIANRTAAGIAEDFQVIGNADGSVSLMATVNRKYVTAESGGNAPLNASRPIVGLWQEFDLR